MKKILLVGLLQVIAVVGYTQDKKKAAVTGELAPAMAVLNTEQQTQVKTINKQFIANMKALLDQPVQNPLERKQKVEKLRTSRDSTLKSILGEQTFVDYRQKSRVKRG